jgi:YD repeat-containing protein
MNRLSSVVQTNVTGGHAVAPKLASFSYDASSQLTDVRRYSATTASTGDLEVHSRMGYDLAGRLTSITHGKTEKESITQLESPIATSPAPPSINCCCWSGERPGQHELPALRSAMLLGKNPLAWLQQSEKCHGYSN